MEMKFIYSQNKALDLLLDKLVEFWISNHIIIEMILELLVYILQTFYSVISGSKVWIYLANFTVSARVLFVLYTSIRLI